VILSPAGEVRYAVVKSVLCEGRMARRREFLGSEMARKYWERQGERLVPKEGLFRFLHEPSGVTGRD